MLPLPDTTLRDEIDAALRRAGVTLRPAMELDGIRMIASLTFDGYGPAILPATAVPAALRERFGRVPFEGLPRRRVGVAQRRPRVAVRPHPGGHRLLDIVANDTAEHPQGLHPAAASAT